MSRTLYAGLYSYEAPRYLREILLSRGGTNPYGEPRYRLVRAEARKRLSRGRWTNWHKSLTQTERTEMRNRAWSTVVETRTIAMYPAEHGWVLEVWFPPEDYGTPQAWAEASVQWIDGEWVSRLGAYPVRGDYESTGYVFPDWALGSGIIAQAVGRIEHKLDSITRDPLKRMREEMSQADEEYENEQSAYGRWANDVLTEHGNVLDVHTPGAQAEVCRLAESIGIRVHPF